MAAMQARESEQASLAEILNEDAFQRESLLVEQLKNEGQAALLQAGNSRAKAVQSALAQTGRDLQLCGLALPVLSFSLNVTCVTLLSVSLSMIKMSYSYDDST